jgi:hypothetical protein
MNSGLLSLSDWKALTKGVSHHPVHSEVETLLRACERYEWDSTPGKRLYLQLYLTAENWIQENPDAPEPLRQAMQAVVASIVGIWSDPKPAMRHCPPAA